jgi:hypothetical protein
MSNSFPARNEPTVLEVFETLFNRDYAGGTLLVAEPHSTQRANGGRAMSSPVVGSRNALKRNAMRFAAALLVAPASLVAGPNAALAAGPQHHDQVLIKLLKSQQEGNTYATERSHQHPNTDRAMKRGT